MALNERNVRGANGGAERDPRLDRLYRAAASEAPPARFDTAILAAARGEVGARPRTLAATLRSWHVPASIAAVVVVTVSLVILVQEEGGEQTAQAPLPALVLRAEQSAARGTQPAPVEEAPKETAQPQAATPAPQRRLSRDDATAPAAVGRRADSAQPEPGPPAASGVASVAMPESGAEALPQTFLAAPRMAGERAASPPADAAAAGRMAGAPAAASEPLVARSAPDATQAKPLARVLAAKPSGQDRQPVWQGFEKEPPEKWLARIEELKRQGRAAEAEEMQSEFKRRFPEHPLAAGSK
ncbi:MAG: hypothetical protein ACREVR_20930 [Burkholderiales bacterium]